MREEGIRMTPNKKIYIGKPIDLDRDVFFERLDALKQFIYGLDRDESMDRSAIAKAVEEQLMELVPTFYRASEAEQVSAENSAHQPGDAEAHAEDEPLTHISGISIHI